MPSMQIARLRAIVDKKFVPVVFMSYMLTTNSAYALDVDPGDYTALDPGTNLGLLYLQHAERNSVYSGGTNVTSKSGLDSDIGILRGVTYQQWGDTLINLQLLLPFGQLKGQGNASSLGSNSGVGDPILANAIFFHKDPVKNRYFAITQYLYVPVGQYDHNESLNLGENRWKYVFQGGYIHGITDRWTLDLTGDVTLFGKNDDYTDASLTLKQDPQFQAQTYLRYKATDKLQVYAGLSRLWGGETELDGVKQNDQPNQKKFMVGGSYFITPKTQLMLTYGEDFSIDDGFKEGARLNFRLLQVF
ncbi:transporter [Pseudomonas sp. VI4.1]|uniref:transporter n=1 Tax=Pseudomonas sp. VI4.1 TaxID=1941346 RepID=UPI0009C50D5D|nr:transporter [Pseudomonas sp. VI4.1]OPK10849.1 hypothetical protein BZ163_07830 [Pseudomonas sp. VI4.1]